MVAHADRYRAKGRRNYGIVMFVLSLALAGYAAARLIFDGPSLIAILQVTFWLPAAFFYPVLARRETVITPASLTLYTGASLRPRTIPRDQIANVHRRTSYSPVRVDLVTGETIELPGVQPGDLDAIRSQLTG